jgi:hypothetical protein
MSACPERGTLDRFMIDEYKKMRTETEARDDYWLNRERRPGGWGWVKDNEKYHRWLEEGRRRTPPAAVGPPFPGR